MSLANSRERPHRSVSGSNSPKLDFTVPPPGPSADYSADKREYRERERERANGGKYSKFTIILKNSKKINLK
jgi:hypothetical protein